jgi:Lon protease-like protein
MTTTLLPAFPLDIVVLPGEDQYLHIFEERYLQLIQELKESHGEFAIPFSENGKVHPYGVLVKIESVFGEGPDNTLYITVEGTGTFKLKNLLERYPGKLYPGAEIEVNLNKATDHSEELEKLLPQMMELLSLYRGDESKISLKSLKSSYFAATLMRLPVEKKLELISLLEEDQRVRWIASELKLQLSICHLELDLQGQFHLN